MVVLCYLVTKLSRLPELVPVLSALSLAAIVVSLPAAAWGARLLMIPFLAGGAWMLINSGIGWQESSVAFGDMANLLALLMMLPICAVPVKLGGYSQAIQAVLRRRVSGVFQLNCLVTTLSFICGSFMSVAAIPVMMTSMEPVVRTFPIRHRERFMAVSTVYGYALSILWSPVSGVVGVIVYTLHVDWLTLFPVLFALSMVCLLANWLLFYCIELVGRPAQIEEINLVPDVTESPLPQLMQMVLAIVLLIVSIVLFEHSLRIGLITVVTLVAVPFALVWSAVAGQAKAFFGEARLQWTVRLPQMADQFVIFLSAGFFAQAIRLSGSDHVANLAFFHLYQVIGKNIFLLLIPPMMLLVSFVGLHPMVVIALLGESLKPEVLGLSSMQLSVAMIGGAVLTYIAGPFSGTLGLVQSINKVSTFRLSLWNSPYATGYIVLLGVTTLLL